MAITEKDITICGHGGGRPSLKVMTNYFQTRYNSIAPNGKHKGIIVVRRLKGMTDKKRQEFHDAYKIILGRNYYSQDRRYYVYTKYRDGYYYSDCSSSYCAALKRIGYNISLLSTAGIYWSDLFEDVPVKIENGHIMNPEILKVGDALLFVGNDPSRPRQIGHIESVYEIKGKVVYKEDSSTTTPTTTTSSSTSTATSTSYLGIVTASALNVRSDAGTNNSIVKTVKNGQPVYITKVKDGWGYIGYGWVSLKYISKKSSITGKVTASALNVRKAPINGDIKRAIKNGTKVTITKFNEENTWAYDSITKGWVSLKFIKF